MAGLPLEFAKIAPQVLSNSGGAPDPFAQILQSITQGAEFGQRASEERGRNSRSSAEMEQRRQEFELKKKALDMELSDKKIALEQEKAKGEALKQLLPVFIQMGGGAQMMQGMQPQGQQGAMQPGTDPAMQAVQQGVQAAPQGPPDLATALSQIPPEILASLVQKDFPQLRELSKDVREVQKAKSVSQSNRMATQALIKHGLIPQGTEEVENAPKLLYDYLTQVRADARAAKKEQTAQAIKGAEGLAGEIAYWNEDWSPSQIANAMASDPSFAGLERGLLLKAAQDAKKPQNETQAKARLTYGPARSAIVVVDALDKKGESLGALARLAQAGGTAGGLVGAGAGGAAGSKGGAAMGKGILGAIIGGGIGVALAPVTRGVARTAMTEDQQRLWNAAQNLTTVVFRGESGGAVTNDEVRQTIERYIPLSTDKPQVREQKRIARQQLNQALASISGLNPNIRQEMLSGLLSVHEQNLLRAPAGQPLRGTTAQF